MDRFSFSQLCIIFIYFQSNINGTLEQVRSIKTSFASQCSSMFSSYDCHTHDHESMKAVI